jgi:hypothetical protein
MRKQSKTRNPAPFLLSIGFTLVYLITLTRYYTFDSVAYAWQILQFEQSGKWGWLFKSEPGRPGCTNRW